MMELPKGIGTKVSRETTRTAPIMMAASESS
jgi:hypothetical protein